MPQFLVKKEEILDNFILLKDRETFFHIVKVLRVKTGEIVKFIDENQNLYISKIVDISKNTLKAQIIKKEKNERLLKCDICLVQSVLNNTESQNLLIANAIQTGVKEIYPVISDNVSTKKTSVENKIEKWEKIALENFKQCERADIAKIHNVCDLKDVLDKFDKKNVIIFAERLENTDFNSLNDIDKNNKIALVVGPEGGFSDSEFDWFIEKGFKLLSLGKLIFKAPNAVVAGVSNVVSRLEK